MANNSKVNISYVMNVLNGEPFIKFQLDSIYPHAHQIIIIEGAYVKFSHAASLEGRSIDRTTEIINNYLDPDNKIVFVQKIGFYDDRLDMCNEFFEHVTGDVIWQVDVDEFYLDSTHIYVKKIFSDNLELDRVCFNFYDFFGSLNYYVRGYENIGLDNIRRVHRYVSGDTWSDQRPPTIMAKNERKVIRSEESGKSMELKGHMMFHPTLLFDQQIKDKYKYYSSISSSVNSPDKWIDRVWLDYKNKFNVSGIKNHVTYLGKFEGSNYPTALVDMYSVVKNGGYEDFRIRNMEDVDNFFASTLSNGYKEIAQDLFVYLYSDVCQSNIRVFLKLIFRAIKTLDRHTLVQFLRVIFRQSLKNMLKRLKIV